MGLIRIDAAGGWPLHGTAASRQVEQAALSSHEPHALMAAAGLAVARLAIAVAPHATRVQVWAGPGNNGGDGLVAARHLLQAGRSVAVCLLGDASRLPPDAAWALDQAREAGVTVTDHLPSGEAADLHIDALLGLGARRPPQDALAAAVTRLNETAATVLAVDLPSGLHSDTGQPLGAAAVRARYTLSLLTLKPGCFTAQGRDHAGQLWLDTLGCIVGAPTAALNGRPAASHRSHASHKGSYGDVAIVGGAAGMVGAAWLAARAALAAGAGRVYMSLLDEQAASFDPMRPELMARRSWWRSAPETLRGCTVVCGCGAGDGVREVLPPLLTHAARLVLDADALNAVAADTALRTLLQRRADRALATLLTPHPLEAARLLGHSAAQVQNDRLAAAAALVADLRCAVLLKGSGSIIAAPAELPRINPTGNAALATAGTGDVLAGWAAGLWAQEPDRNAADVASAAAWWHGHAADVWAAQYPARPLRAADLIERLATS